MERSESGVSGSIRRKFDCPEDVPLLLQVGDFHPTASPRDLLDSLLAAEGRYTVCFCIPSGSPDSSPYECQVRKIAENDKRVKILSALSVSDISELMRSADALLVSGRTDTAVPAILAAMCSGLAWVALPEVPGISDFAGGITVPLEMFPYVLSVLSDDPRFREMLGETGRQQWAKFGPKDFALCNVSSLSELSGAASHFALDAALNRQLADLSEVLNYRLAKIDPRMLLSTYSRPLKYPGFTFCIITNGTRLDVLEEEIESIHALQIPRYEILVCGDVPAGLDRVHLVEAVDAARKGRLGEMRNKAKALAHFDHLVISDDDFVFHADFYTGLLKFGYDYDVLCARILNRDGTRYWDWAVHDTSNAGQHLLDYSETSPNVYVTGGLANMKAAVSERCHWDDRRGFYQKEDVDFSERLHQAGFRIQCCPLATTTHNDPRYTNIGNVPIRNYSLEHFENIGNFVMARGITADLGGFRWLKRECELRIPAKCLNSPVRLSFSLSTGPAHFYSALPFDVVLRKDGVGQGRLKFTAGEQKFSVALELPPSSGDSFLSIFSEDGFAIRAKDSTQLLSVMLTDLQLSSC